jgi:Protein of unknown function (DUF2892)
MDTFFAFMEGPAGRALRVVLGLVLIYFGLMQIGGIGGRSLAFAGLLPIVMGAWGPCLVNLAIHRFKRA